MHKCSFVILCSTAFSLKKLNLPVYFCAVFINSSKTPKQKRPLLSQHIHKTSYETVFTLFFIQTGKYFQEEKSPCGRLTLAARNPRTHLCYKRDPTTIIFPKVKQSLYKNVCLTANPVFQLPLPAMLELSVFMTFPPTSCIFALMSVCIRMMTLSIHLHHFIWYSLQ